MVQLKTIKDQTDLLVSFNFPQKTPKSKCSSCDAMRKNSNPITIVGGSLPVNRTAFFGALG